MPKVEENEIHVVYDFTYTTKDERVITVKTGEKLFLINKTNNDWWQVIRSCEERPFFVPASYVKEAMISEKVDYQNLEFFQKIADVGKKLEKPVPKARTKVPTLERGKPDNNDVQSDSSSDKTSDNDNRAKNSYNLHTAKQYDCPRIARKQSVPLHKRKPLEANRNLSKSLERLAQEIKFEPKIRSGNSNSSASVFKPDDVKHSEKERSELSKEGKESLRRSFGQLKTTLPILEESKKGFLKNDEKVGSLGKNSPNFERTESKRSSTESLRLRDPKSSSPRLPQRKTSEKNIPELLEEVVFSDNAQPEDSHKYLNEKTKREIIEELTKEITEKKEAKDIENMAVKGVKTDGRGMETPSLFCGTVRSVSKESKDKRSSFSAKRESLRGRSSDAGVVLSEKKTPSKSRSIFSSFKRKKQACVISSSWEGLDKIVELEDKPQVTAFGLQRSKTFMTPEKPKPTTRLDAYNHRWTSFKPPMTSTGALREEDVTSRVEGSSESILSADGEKRPFTTRKASLVRNRRVDSTKQGRMRVPVTPPPEEQPRKDLGDGWEEYQVEGRPYYFNKTTRETSLKPPRKVAKLQFGGSRDSIASSELSSPVHSTPSPSPKFSSGTSLDRLTPTERVSRSSLDRLTPIDMAPSTPVETNSPVSSPPSVPSPLDNSPSYGEGLELSDHVYAPGPIPEGWVETKEKSKKKDAPKKAFIHVRTGQKYATWPPRKQAKVPEDCERTQTLMVPKKKEDSRPASLAVQFSLEGCLVEKWVEDERKVLPQACEEKKSEQDIWGEDGTDAHKENKTVIVEEIVREDKTTIEQGEKEEKVVGNQELSKDKEKIFLIETQESSESETRLEISSIKLVTEEFEHLEKKFDVVLVEYRELRTRTSENPELPSSNDSRRKSIQQSKEEFLQSTLGHCSSMDVCGDNATMERSSDEEEILESCVNSDPDAWNRSTNEVLETADTAVLEEIPKSHSELESPKTSEEAEVSLHSPPSERIATELSSGDDDDDDDNSSSEDVWLDEDGCANQWERLSEYSRPLPARYQDVFNSILDSMRTEISRIDQVMATYEVQNVGSEVENLVDYVCKVVEDVGGRKCKKKPPVRPRMVLPDENGNEVSPGVSREKVCGEDAEDGLKVPEKLTEKDEKPSALEQVPKEVAEECVEPSNLELVPERLAEQNSKKGKEPATHEQVPGELNEQIRNYSKNQEVLSTPGQTPKSTDKPSELVSKPPIPPARRRKHKINQSSENLPPGVADGNDYENHELLMLKRTTDSTKVRRRAASLRRSNIEDDDVIIEWGDSMMVVQEPIFLESKSIPIGSDSSVDGSEDFVDPDDDVALRSNSWSHFRHRPLLSADLRDWCSEELSDSESDWGKVPRKGLGRSRSVGYFSEFYSEDSLVSKCGSCGYELERKDVEAWMDSLRWEPLEEADFEKWYAAYDKENRIYFYHEHSNVSRWDLPDLPDPPKEAAGSIQRSSTESAIPQNGADPVKRNLSKDKGRSTKALSLIVDGKINLEPKKLHPELSEHLRIGLLHRTKILDNGRKCNKKWQLLYTVLCKSSLYFFKDEKTYLQMRDNQRIPDTSRVSHKLQGAEIDEGGKSSARKNVYRITWPETKVAILVQHDDPVYIKEWIRAIQSTIDEQPRSRKDSSSSCRNASNDSLEIGSPVKIHRSKSIKGKVKGSSEDLTGASSSDNKSKIGEILKKFILRRPSSDSLRQKGILRDEPVFGCSLETITLNREPRVPVFVERCIHWIEATEENLKTDGLYRASGNLSQVQKIRLEVDQNRLDILEHEEDVHVLTGSLKLFFRELKEPLIPFQTFHVALRAYQNSNPKLRIKDLKKAMDSLPKANYDTLKFLLRHLVKVQKYKADNRMDMSNLAIVFGPSLTWPADDSSINMAIDLMCQNRLIEALLKEFSHVFGDS